MNIVCLKNPEVLNLAVAHIRRLMHTYGRTWYGRPYHKGISLQKIHLKWYPVPNLASEIGPRGTKFSKGGPILA